MIKTIPVSSRTPKPDDCPPTPCVLPRNPQTQDCPPQLYKYVSFCLTFFPKNTNHSRGPWLPDRPNSWCNSCSAPLLLWRSEQKKQNANQFLYSRCKVKARRIWHFKVSKEEFSAAAVKRLASMVQWSSILLCGRTNQTGRPQMLKGYNKKT